MKRILFMLAMAAVMGSQVLAQETTATATTAASTQKTAAKKTTEKKAAKGKAKKKDSDKKGSKITLTDARNAIGKIIENPSLMTKYMKALTPEEQKTFVADVNKAIGELPASTEEKSAKYLNVNHAAVLGAAKGNLQPILAEIFATVPPDALTVLSDRFATDLFDRDSATTKYTDAEFQKIARATIAVIAERNKDVDNGPVRNTFAVLMFIRASHITAPEFVESLVELIGPVESQEMAKTEWIPAALGTTDENGKTVNVNYEPLLASADAGRRPDLEFVLTIAGPQFNDSVLTDLMGKNNDPMTYMNARTPVLDAVETVFNTRGPNLGADFLGAAGAAGNGLGGTQEEGDKEPNKPSPTPSPEPSPYPWQSTL